MAFPSSPTTGATYTSLSGVSYIYAASGGWKISGSSSSSTSVVPDAALGVAIPDNSFVTSSDGKVLFSNTGAALTPTTGLTEANLITDGFTSLGGSSSSVNYVAQTTAPVTTTLTAPYWWYETTNEILFTMIDDGVTKTWVDVTTAGGAAKVYIEAITAPAVAGYSGGDVWYDTVNEIAYVLIEQGGAKVWVGIV
jgi:hypothetical protein